MLVNPVGYLNAFVEAADLSIIQLFVRGMQYFALIYFLGFLLKSILFRGENKSFFKKIYYYYIFWSILTITFYFIFLVMFMMLNNLYELPEFIMTSVEFLMDYFIYAVLFATKLLRTIRAAMSYKLHAT